MKDTKDVIVERKMDQIREEHSKHMNFVKLESGTTIYHVETKNQRSGTVYSF